jgi:hypothetical protein
MCFRASGLSLLTAAIVHWNTTYLDRAVQHLRAQGVVISNELLAHVAPLGWGNYSPPHWNRFILLNQQLTPVSSRCRVVNNCGRDTSRAASREAGLIASSGTLLA